MLFTGIFLSLLIAGWSICAAIPWLVRSVMTKGEVGCLMGLLCLFAGNVAGMAVPIVGFDGWGGLWASFPFAAIVSAALLAARAFAPTSAPRLNQTQPGTTDQG